MNTQINEKLDKFVDEYITRTIELEKRNLKIKENKLKNYESLISLENKMMSECIKMFDEAEKSGNLRALMLEFLGINTLKITSEK